MILAISFCLYEYQNKGTSFYIGTSEYRNRAPSTKHDFGGNLMRKLLLAGMLATALAVIESAAAQDYPVKPVKIITHSAAGGAPDVTLRIIGGHLSRIWRQQVLVLNQPGGGGATAARTAADSMADGYTFYMPTTSAFIALPGAAKKLPLEVPRDFAPIGFVSDQPMVIAVAAPLAVMTLPDLIALAKKRPGEISYATTGRGTLTHLTGALLQSRTGIQLTAIPYSGGASQALNDIVSGRVSMIIEGYVGLAAAIQGNLLRPIAVASPQRLPELPHLPTVAETVSGFAASGWQVLVAPAGTSDAIVRKVSDDLRRALAEPEVKTRLAALGAYVRPMSADEVTAFIHREQQMWKPALQRISEAP
jgi:tripartite-type tricarboxylate transporter receptor subunit TctC